MAMYAMLCAENGITIDWRKHVPDCQAKCPNKMDYSICSKMDHSACQTLQMEDFSTEFDNLRCLEGCSCEYGKFWDVEQSCVWKSQCH